MAPRTSWRGSISFGLVNVPIGLVTAVSPKDVKFNQFTLDLHPVGRKEIDKTTGDELTRDEIFRGMKIGDEIVLVSDEELENLAPIKSTTIEIEKFVDGSEIDPIYFDSHSYAVPSQGGEKGYALLVASLEKSGKVGIARVVRRSKQHVVAVRAVEGALCVTFLNYDDEVRSVAELGLKPTEVKDAEVDMAIALIGLLESEWKPEEYQDEHRAKVLELIESKASGIPTVPGPKVAESFAQVDNLMAALAASIEASKKAVAA